MTGKQAFTRVGLWRMRSLLAGALIWGALALTAPAREVVVTLLNTTDLHGSIRRTPGRYVEHNEGSLLQCASLIGEVRAQTPNVLLVDCGDIFQGTAESYLSRGMVMARAMNWLGYDAWAVGNHEFDWGLDALGRLLNKMEAVPLAANIKPEKVLPGFARIQPWIIKEVAGLRVGIVGLTTPNLPNWFRELEPAGVRVLDSRRALEQVMPQVRKSRPDILILLVHQGLATRDDEANQINAICRRFSEFDVVLGGHLHWVLPGTKLGQTDYAQAGSGARGVLRVDLTYDTCAGRVTDKAFTYLPVQADTPEDAELAAALADDLAEADRWMQTVVGHAVEPIRCSVGGSGLCAVQQLLCAAIAEGTGADVVLHGILSTESIEAGDIRVEDIWRVVPYENKIGCVRLTVGEIRDIMEEATEYLGTARYFGTWGLQYELHRDAPPGRRIRQVRGADGRVIHPKTRLSVALNSYHLAGGGGRFPTLMNAIGRPNARLQYAEASTRQMVLDYIAKHPKLTILPGTNAVVVRQEEGSRRR